MLTYIDQASTTSKTRFIANLSALLLLVTSAFGSFVGLQALSSNSSRLHPTPQAIPGKVDVGKGKRILPISYDPHLISNLNQIVQPNTPPAWVPQPNEGDPQGIRTYPKAKKFLPDGTKGPLDYPEPGDQVSYFFTDLGDAQRYMTIPPGLNAMAITFEQPQRYPGIVPEVTIS